MDKIKIYKWFLVSFMAIALTALALIYQGMNGPTKPKKVELWLNDNQVYKFKLPRSYGGANNCLIELPVSDPQVSGEIYYRKFPTNDPWQQTNLFAAEDSRGSRADLHDRLCHAIIRSGEALPDFVVAHTPA
jgi:hypothetical protein